MNFENIKLVAFDLGYTLVYNKREDNYSRYLKHKNLDIPREKIERAFHRADKTFMRFYQGMLGQLQEYYFPWYLGVVNYYLDVRLNIMEQASFLMQQDKSSSSYWEPFPWTKEVLQALKQSGFQIALLSNWDSGCRDLLKKLDLYNYFDDVIVSAEMNIQKPDSRIFEYLMQISRCGSEEILYVGDNYYDDVLGSRKVGIDSVLINRFGNQGIEEIEECEIISDTRQLLSMLRCQSPGKYQTIYER